MLDSPNDQPTNKAGMTPVVLAIAGSDSGGGAGIQADLRAIGALGCFGCTAITAVTAQNPREVTGIWPIPADGVAAQIAAVANVFPIAAVKTGMLANADIIREVAQLLEVLDLPLVVDPVMIATSGGSLLEHDAIDALCTDLLPLATVITPNIPEAEALLGCGLVDDVAESAMKLADKYETAVLLKGGHRLEGDQAIDFLAQPGRAPVRLAAPVINAQSTHGTGCTLAAAVAAGLAQGLSVDGAAKQGKRYVSEALRSCMMLDQNLAALGAPKQI